MMTVAFLSPLLPARPTWRPPRRLQPPRGSLTAPHRAARAAKSSKLPPSQSHFLHVDDFSTAKLQEVLQTALKIKQNDLLNDPNYRPLLNKAMAMVFAKPSSRTRVSFETGMFKLGGHALALGPEVGVNTREAGKDVSRVLSGMTDVIMARLFAHDDIVEVAEFATVPVINGLTDYNHPCQIVSDALTMLECCGKVEGARVVYVGDGNNMVHSWLELAAILPIDFTCCCPTEYKPDMGLVQRAQDVGLSKISVCHDAMEAVRGADFVYADVWASMGMKEEIEQRERAFEGFQITGDMMRQAGKQARFLHCLPAERGRECTDEVLEADYSVVFQQAENRLHAQIAIVMACLGVDAAV